jgi:hypothetical protein
MIPTRLPGSGARCRCLLPWYLGTNATVRQERRRYGARHRHAEYRTPEPGTYGANGCARRIMIVPVTAHSTVSASTT